MISPTLTMGILAHVDAGKTSLTERLLYDAGVIDAIGSVDDGSTQTDSMDLERQRGITIRSAVVSFPIGDRTVNLIDTPGHSDFIAEVERALRVLDAAVLVISAVEGVQAQTRILMRTLIRLRIPTLLFVNKIDRRGARYDDLLHDITTKLSPQAVALGNVSNLGAREACFERFGFDDPAFLKQLGEVLAVSNDDFLAAYLDGVPTGERELLAEQTGNAEVFPVFFGSAMTGAGLPELAEGIRTLLPGRRPAGRGPHGEVFKIERGTAGERIAYVSLYDGSLAVRDRVTVHRRTGSYEAKISALQVFGHEGRATRAEHGRIARVWGLGEVRIGDQLGRYEEHAEEVAFTPPTLETAVRPAGTGDETALYLALTKLAEQDPLIRLRTRRGEVSVCLYGEVQTEVVKSLLHTDFGIAAVFDETQPIHLERPHGTGEALTEIDAEGNPYVAGIGLRVEPLSPGSGVVYHLEVELGALPRAFHTAIEETVRLELQEGRYGWEVTDCLIALTHTAYSSPVSVAGDFRKLAPLVLAAALEQAGTDVYEPMQRFDLEVPPDSVSGVLAKLADAGATVHSTSVQDAARLTGMLPAGRVHGFEIQLPGLSHGEGVLVTAFDGYRRAGVNVRRRA